MRPRISRIYTTSVKMWCDDKIIVSEIIEIDNKVMKNINDSFDSMKVSLKHHGFHRCPDTKTIYKKDRISLKEFYDKMILEC